MAEILRFRPLQSCVDVTFWSELGNRKLDQYKLAETPVEIQGSISASKYDELSSPFQVLSSSFQQQGLQCLQGSHGAPGRLLLLNTTEAFNKLDKPAALRQVGQLVWSDIVSGAAEAAPQLLSRFLLLVHGDLKHFVFTYWFAFPALKPPQPFSQLSAQALSAAYPDLQQQMCAAADAWRTTGPSAAAAAAAGSQPAEGWAAGCSSASAGSTSSPASMFCLMVIEAARGQVHTAPLSSWHQLQHKHKQQQPHSVTGSATQTASASSRDAQAAAAAAAGGEAAEVLLVMFDPCSDPLTPGWPLRNALLLAAVRWGVQQLKVLCVRDSNAGCAKAERCFVLQVGLPEVPDGWRQPPPGAAVEPCAPEVLGWEANAEGKLRPRVVNLAPFMSPVQLAEQAVDLNLRLMRWRAAPDLDVAALAAQRCLLLGAGTLGCAVARTLLAWGVRHITFVDSARVSFSNPVRQSLFTYQDCLDGGAPKAAAAAEALRAIFPSVQACGLDLVIPMPGHPPANAKAEAVMEQAVSKLQQLVSGHDVIFLLTDTRESRWLPTLLAAASRKVAVTAALGFDTFLVMRHGLPGEPPAAAAAAAGANELATTAPGATTSTSTSSIAEQQRRRLGCYFCNDVVAPTNSTIDRTLDQQCTVARPGLAPIAGALAVELMAALLQHPSGGHAAATDAAVGPLGPVPHMIRGSLSGFSQTCMVGQAFSQCTACSPAVLQQYEAEGWGFVARVLQNPGQLEELTGLAELHRQAAALQLSSGSSEEGEAAGGDAADDWTEL